MNLTFQPKRFILSLCCYLEARFQGSSDIVRKPNGFFERKYIIMYHTQTPRAIPRSISFKTPFPRSIQPPPRSIGSAGARARRLPSDALGAPLGL